ncbi:MAG: hypothetical protein D6715_11130 [Calditrichaeota bacterium]|nr:MAG: hypothetical protein D6715_11130 [Calditrichota bacterium]
MDRHILHYQLQEELGRGGMGIVYRAIDRRLKREVALKFLASGTHAGSLAIPQFLNEAQAAAALNHPNIAQIYAIEEHDDEMFIVMEYVQGQELRHLVGAQHAAPLRVDQILDIASQIAEGLQAAHEKGIVHRDLTSANVMMTPGGQVKIMDFGLAQFSAPITGQSVKKRSGTVAFMSPEQIRGEALDPRTDIWSFGVILYHLFSGRLPFEGVYKQAVIYAILNEAIPPLSQTAPHVPEHLQQMVAGMLQRNRAHRYQRASEVLQRLKQAVPPEASAPSGKLPWLALMLIFTLSAVAAFWLALNSPGPSTTEKTLAVLPFADLSEEQNQAYFADGLTEELLNRLARIPRLRVAYQTSSFLMKGTGLDLSAVARRLNVAYVLKGSVQRSGNTMRVSAQLIQAENHAHLWSGTFDRQLDDIFAVEAEIARAVSAALNLTLLNGGERHNDAQTSSEAYTAFLQGEYFRKQRRESSLNHAVGYYRQAIELDPTYARAWVGLANAQIRLADFGYLPTEEGYRLARAAVRRALVLDDRLAEAHLQLARIQRSYDWDWHGADASLKRALALEPGNADALRFAALQCFTLGHLQDGLTFMEKAIERDPVFANLRYDYGILAYYAGLLDLAEAAFQKTLELNPDFPAAHLFLARVNLARQEADSALQAIEQEIEPAWRLFGLALVHFARKDLPAADGALAELIQTYQNQAAYQIAQVFAYRNQPDKAFAWLERAYRQRDGGLAEMKNDPLLRNLEGDERYNAFLARMNLPL